MRVFLLSKGFGNLLPPSSKGSEELLIALDKGRPSCWRTTEERQLTYAVRRTSFPDERKYKEVVKLFADAAKEWVDRCPTCGLGFKHLQELDTDRSLDKVRFTVEYRDVGGAYIAAAFFPHYPAERRIVTIDPSFFSTTFRKTGVLVHEIGHILGFRHEHTQGIAGCYFEAKLEGGYQL